MSRFQDYLSSAITPQMTLLEKFNALIKFLKENNFISVFYSSENYNPTTENYQISNVSTLNYKLKLGDCVIFSNGYYAFVETLGETTFTIGSILYFQGQQGVSIVSANINNTGNLILTLSDGNTINAGNTGAVKDFIIDENQHLIVRYLNGTQNDLGNIFNGDITISGAFTQHTPNYLRSMSFNAVENITLTNRYSVYEVINNVLYIIVNVTLKNETQNNVVVRRFSTPYQFFIPDEYTEKIIDFDGNTVLGNAEHDNTLIAMTPALVSRSNYGYFNTIINADLRFLNQPSARTCSILCQFGEDVNLAPNEALYYSARMALTLI